MSNMSDMTMERAAELAIDVQNACNLSGVVHSFSKVMTCIWDEANRQGKGTEWVNTHPIVILFVSKLDDLSRYSYSDEIAKFGKAYDVCAELAGRPALGATG